MLTHRHLDHAGAVALVRDELGVDGRSPAAEPERREPLRRARRRGPARSCAIVREGDRVGPFEVIETPGHAADHVALFTDERELFCGDTVLGEGSVFIPPGGGSLGRYLESLRAPARRSTRECLYPGHGPVVRDPRAKLDEYIEHRLERERRLVEALDARPARHATSCSTRSGTTRPPSCARPRRLTLEAHLDKLEREGRLPDGVERLAAELDATSTGRRSGSSLGRHGQRLADRLGDLVLDPGRADPGQSIRNRLGGMSSRGSSGSPNSSSRPNSS